jgi:Na+-translocating ferredoxin:NAD+ oxidoreductase subunit G
MDLVKSQIPNPKSQRAWLALLGVWALGLGISGLAQVTREEALAHVYPGADIRAEQIFLTPAQVTQVAKRAATDPASALVARYVATRGGQAVGRAYIDTHTVRTKRESLLVALDANGRVIRVDVTAFLEPAEFRAPGPWLGQYRGRTLDDDLAVNRAIRPIAGATLTARAANSAVRRVLAIDELLRASGDQR